MRSPTNRAPAPNGADADKAKADAEAREKAEAEAKAKADDEARQKAISDAAAIAEANTRAATPVVRVTALRDRWRAGRHWPKGDTDLTLAEAEQLGRAGFDMLREDNVFTIVPLDRAD